MRQDTQHKSWLELQKWRLPVGECIAKRYLYHSHSWGLGWDGCFGFAGLSQCGAFGTANDVDDPHATVGWVIDLMW